MPGIAIISHPDCVLHNAGVGHPEQPARVQVIQKAIEQYPFAESLQFYPAPLATRDQLLFAHEANYVDWIDSIAPRDNTVSIDADTVMNRYTYNAALRAVGAVIFAVDLVLSEKAQVAFCNVRPPGHHAEKDKAMGFCFFNNVAIGALYALRQASIKRVAIVDFDVHHGNGTQNIFQKNPRVLYCSSFEHPFYPGYDPELDNEHIICVPLVAGTSGKVFREKVTKAWFASIAAFKPDLIFFSAGFDAHINDPLAALELQCADYVWLTEEIKAIAEACCQGKMISVLEGGYNLNALAECVPAHVAALI